MKVKMTAIFLVIIMFVLSGCSTYAFDKGENENTQLRNDNLLSENDRLNSELNKLKSKIIELESRNNELQNQLNKINKEKEDIEKRMTSAQSRLLFRDVKDVLSTFSIIPEPEIENDWCYLARGNLRIRLNGYTNAQIVKFMIMYLYSEGEPYVFYIDKNPKDGWQYEGNLFKSKEQETFKFNQGYLLYASVTDKEGHEFITEKLPFYFSN